MERTIENAELLINKGYTQRQLADTFNITQTPMRMWLKKNNLRTQCDPKKRRLWSDDDLLKAVSQSVTMADVLRRVGLQVRPGNYDSMRIHIKRLGLDTSHFTGHAHGTGGASKYSNKDVFTSGSSYSRHHIKARVVKQNLLTYECDICKLSEWLGRKIVLVLDHKNGINNDHRLENLRFLCPNCNSQQLTFCRKNMSS